LTVGFTYLHGEAEDPVTGGDDETDQGLISAVYNIGPGVDLWGGVKFFEYEDDQGSDANQNEGYIVAVGSSISF
jgi:predicted porin